MARRTPTAPGDRALTRREVLAVGAWIGGGLALAPLLGACGGGSTGPPAPRRSGVGVDLARADVVRAPGSPAAGRAAAESTARFAMDLYDEVAGARNLVLSPWSAMVALEMARAGARGRTAGQMDEVLGGSPSELGPGLGWLDRRLEAQAGTRRNASGKPGAVSLDSANSLWAQRGVPWKPSFLRVLGRDFGAGVHQVDFRSDPGAATRAVNTWTAHRTHDRIRDLVPQGALDPMTRLVLVNAIWFKAPWFSAFRERDTYRATFHRPGAPAVRVPMMSGHLTGAGHAAGPGWQAVRMPYAGQQVAMTVVVPDAVDGLPGLVAQLRGGGLFGLLGAAGPAAVDLEMPRWTFRTSVSLKAALSGLGMTDAFGSRADFTGMTEAERLLIDDVLQQAFIAVDEEGTEAAAATAAVMRATSLPAGLVRVRADRPFLFVVHDVATATPLFLGQVTDPTA